jgi:LCP family protein required for cell wall assembly
MGRGAAFNGNGRAILPPGALSPVARYRQPPPKRRGRLVRAGRVLGWLVVALMMCAGGLAGGLYLYFHESVAAVAADTPELKVAQKRLSIPVAGEPATALVIGYDRRYSGVDANENSRSDTIMLVRADPKTKSISMLSFPRDLAVPIYCPGQPGSHIARINQAFTDCGPKGTVETVKNLTGLPINYLITVNFRGFVRIVDRLGGVWMDVDRRYFNDRSGPGGYATINLQPGYQQLGGYQALDFVRYRHTDSDLYRLARQQAFVRAFKDRVHSAFKPLKIPKLINDITRNTRVAVGGGKGVSPKTVVSYAYFAYSLPPGHFFQSKIEGLEENASFDIFASEDNVRRAVQLFAHPDVESPEKATNVVLGVKAKRKHAPAPRNTTVNVLNGNGVAGDAANASFLLSQRGYQTVLPPSGELANAPRSDYFQTKVYYDPEQTGSNLAARTLANLFGSADIGKIPRSLRLLANNAMLVVVVGQTFHGSLAEAPVDQTPKREAPKVAPGTSASIDYLRERAKKVPFPVMVPTVIERTSWIDRERPARLYRVDPDHKHKAVRLTYRTGANEYWGIQMTDWKDAPVLGERNFTRRIKGRRYELHYSGPKLHMVVLRKGDATYWVVNTLLDSLSNETMLAIAKGLKPISSIK